MARVKDNEREADWGSVAFVILVALFSAVGGFYFQPAFEKSRDAATVLTTVVSILAGFLMAIMAIVGDARSLRGKTWRQDTWYLNEARRQLLRYQVLFILYLSVLVLLFTTSLGLTWPEALQVWVERVMLGLATFTLLISFRLPADITRRQVRQLVELIQERRDGLKQDDERK